MNRGKSVQFFATKQDLVPALESIESVERLTFVEDRVYESAAIPTFNSVLALPELGKVASRRSPRYLVLPAGERVRLSRVVQIGKRSEFARPLATALALAVIRPPGGKVTSTVRHWLYPTSIVFAPGGFWNPQVLVAGEIVTMHKTSASLDLYELFCREVVRGFTKVKSFEVGSEGLSLLKSGCRLTIDVKAGTVIDLVLD